jgi:HAD superfamily hydrolase (TIGR01509 family)
MEYPFQITAERFELPPGSFRGLIFDCDGTLVDSMPLHLKAWRAALEKHGFAPDQFTLTMHHAYAGMPGVAIVADLNQKFATQLDPAEVEKDKVAWYLAHHHEVGEVKPVVDFARNQFGRTPMAVASGSDRKLVEMSLESLGIQQLFDVVITPEMVSAGKPAPEMFLLAAEKIGIPPHECLVFEDGHLGMQAAAAAGMAAVWIAV